MKGNRENIVLVTVDSLRADHCGFTGYGRKTTPEIDAMAEEGMVFESAIAPGPSTPESMPAAFTGQYPIPRDSESDSDLNQRRTRIREHMHVKYTLPERLSNLGYRTAAFTPNPFTSRHFGFDQGFDHFQDFMSESTRGSLYQRLFQGFLKGSELSSMARVIANFWQREEVFKPWESYYGEIAEWLRDAKEPYFLWVFLMDAHNPYLPSSEYRTQARWKEFHANFEFWRQSHEMPFSDTVHERLVTAYDDSVRYCDAFLERLRSDLEREAIWIVHGDHGEAFGEHGTYGHEPRLHEENVRVPLVVDGLDDGVVSSPVSLRSLPEMMTTIGSERGLPTSRHSPECVTARTRQGGRGAMYDSQRRYVLNSQTAEEESIPEDALRTLGRELESTLEETRISTAAAELTGEVPL
jgi:arylsulfatase